jgi:hypothetical protein
VRLPCHSLYGIAAMRVADRMRAALPLTRLLTILLVFAAIVARAPAATALDAVRFLPKGEAKKLARIEGREGAPAPDRWYLLIHDELSETGLREYVVVAGEVVASRTLSQFAETLTPEDVIGGEVVKFDSDKAARLVQLYAAANQLTVTAIHYQLRKAGPDAVPLWTLHCVDATGKEVGRLVVSATRGSVISHDGFAVEPPLPTPAPTPATPTPAPVAKAKPKPKIKPPAPELPTATPIPMEAPPAVAERPGFFDRVRGSIQKVLPGKKAEER